ncbi:MAG: type II toxin-antitoxin system PemK/MazF family toxin [Rhodospirillaceae bacterium]|nr:type II toxin-antitoxin system PemK/MazF family toxin [Rhodospirillaceae bacterium]
MIFDRWDVIVAPYPYVEISRAKLRPALVLTARGFNGRHAACFAAMISTARQMTDLRDDDVQIEDLEQAGLRRPCVVRLSRVTTVDLEATVRKIGMLDVRQRPKVEGIVKEALGL